MTVTKFTTFDVPAIITEKDALAIAMKANTARLNAPTVDVWVYFQAPVSHATYTTMVSKLEEGIFLAFVQDGKIVARQKTSPVAGVLAPMNEKEASTDPKQTKKEKVELTMENVKTTVTSTINTGKEKLASVTASVKENGFFKSLSNLYTATAVQVKKGFASVKGFVSKQASTIGITAGAVVVAGAVTSSATAAVAVGAGISLAVVAAMYLAKKKEKEADSKEMLITAATIFGTAFALPFALYGAAMVGLLATTFAVILPYAVIVA